MRKRIAVVGTDARLNPKVESMAYGIGKSVAENGCVLVCGGRGGVMEAACRGAKDAGGLTVGVLPSIDGLDANEYVDVPLPTGIGYARNALVVSAADAVISVAGSVGTLSEIAMALNYGRPVVCVVDSGGVSSLLKEIAGGDEKLREITFAESGKAVAEALKKIK